MQCKMARNGLGWSIQELAERAEVRPATISAFERGGDALQSTVTVIRDVLTATGRVRFEGDSCVCVEPE